MNPDQQESSYRSERPDDVTLGEFVLGLVDVMRWLKGHWWQLGLAVLIGVGILSFLKFKEEPQYQATLTFILADDHSGQMGGIGNVLGQFGIPLSSGKYNIDKLLGVAKSRSIIQEAVLASDNINGQPTILGNALIEIYELDKQWAKNKPEMQGYRLKNSLPMDTLNMEMLYALKSLHNLVVGTSADRSRALVQMDYGNMDYIMNFKTTTLNPDLSIALSQKIFEHLKSFYVAKAIEKTQATYDLIVERRDSIAEVFQKTEFEIAQLKDRSLTTFQNTDNLRLSNLTTQSYGLKIALQEIEKNLSIAELSLKSSTPLIQKIDDPTLPINPIPKNWIRTIILGVILGVGFYMLGLFIYTLIRLV